MIKKIFMSGLIGIISIGGVNSVNANNSKITDLQREIYSLLESSKGEFQDGRRIGLYNDFYHYNSYFNKIKISDDGNEVIDSDKSYSYKVFGDLNEVSENIVKYVEEINKKNIDDNSKIKNLSKIKNSILIDKTKPYLRLGNSYAIIKKGSEEERQYKLWEKDPESYSKLDYEIKSKVLDISSNSNSNIISDDLGISSNGFYLMSGEYELSGLSDNFFKGITMNDNLGKKVGSDGIERYYIGVSFIDGFGNYQDKEPETFIVYISSEEDIKSRKIYEIAEKEKKFNERARKMGYKNSEIIENELFGDKIKNISFDGLSDKEALEVSKLINELFSIDLYKSDKDKKEIEKEMIEDTNKKEKNKIDNKIKDDSIKNIKEEDMKIFEKDGGRYKIDTSKLSCNKVQYVLNNFSTNYFKDTKDIVIATFRDANVVKGVDGLNFEPKRGITRAEFLSVLMKALCEDPKYQKHNFPDVKRGHWTDEVIGKSFGLKWIRGYEDGTIRPNGNISKLEVLYVLHRLSKIEVLEFPENFKLLNLNEKMRSDIARKSVYLGLIKDENINLNDPINREEMLYILKKLFGVMKGES